MHRENKMIEDVDALLEKKEHAQHQGRDGQHADCKALRPLGHRSEESVLMIKRKKDALLDPRRGLGVADLHVEGLAHFWRKALGGVVGAALAQMEMIAGFRNAQISCEKHHQ